MRTAGGSCDRGDFRPLAGDQGLPAERPAKGMPQPVSHPEQASGPEDRQESTKCESDAEPFAPVWEAAATGRAGEIGFEEETDLLGAK